MVPSSRASLACAPGSCRAGVVHHRCLKLGAALAEGAQVPANRTALTSSGRSCILRAALSCCHRVARMIDHRTSSPAEAMLIRWRPIHRKVENARSRVGRGLQCRPEARPPSMRLHACALIAGAY